MSPQFSRREFCNGLAALAATGVVSAPSRSAAATPPASAADPTLAGEKFTPWTPGCLDLHHIATGRGSSMLAICPDGTVMMVDAGAIYDALKYTIPPRPNGSHRPGEWIARYVGRHIRAAGASAIDHLLVSHLHADHLGQWAPQLPRSQHGDYLLTGVTDLAEQLPIRKLTDRAYPNYDYPPVASFATAAADRLTFENYRSYVAQRRARSETTERFVAGARHQMSLVHAPDKYPGFEVRNLAANGVVWTGAGDEAEDRFPDLSTLAPAEYPTENMCSAAIRIQHGRFRYYTGGDLPSDPVGFFADVPWKDIATAVARAAGPVSVAVANHHGYVDSMGIDCVRALRPRVFVILGWDSAHPTIRPLYNMLSRNIYPEERDIFATAIKEENAIATRDLLKLKSQNGHVVVRVPPGGESFRVQILDNADESDRVIATHGPWSCV